MIFGTGIDIVEIERIAKAIERWGEHFLKHVFTDNEIKYVNTHKFSAQHFAARFAAKEAVYKAIDGNDKKNIGWKDIEVLNEANGKPICQCSKIDVNQKILISLSHSKKYAVANAIIVRKYA